MLKVLIAEDNVILADILEEYLMAEGYAVCGIAFTVGEAVMLANRHKPDLAVLDFRLVHGEYGSQIRPRIRDRSAMGILYASGDPLNNTLTAADGEAYLQKPYGMNDLLRALRIVHAIRTGADIAGLAFPKNFYLLENTPHEHRRSA